MRFDFAGAGRHLTVVTGDPWTARILDGAFAPMRCAPHEPDWAAHVERRGAQLALRFDSYSLSFSTKALGSFGAAFAATREIFARFAAAVTNASALYGACAALHDGGVVFLGASGIGKTVLLFHLVQRGLRFLGDETVLADWQSGVVRAQPRLPALREHGLALLPSQALRNAIASSPHVANLSGGRYWYALPPQHLLGIAPDETPHRLRAIVVLRGRAARPQIDELSRDDVFRLVAERSYFKPASLHDLARMRRSLCDVRALEVFIGEPESTADLLFEALQCA